MSSNRLQELMKKTEPQYVEGSPLLLLACALYLDRNNGNCIAQLKWKNISVKKIKAVSVELEVFDSFDNAISNISHHYRNVDVGANATFGEKEAILIDDEKANRFTVKIDAVSFDDGSVFRLEQKQCLAPLPDAQELPLTGEMLDQYKRDISKLGFIKSAFCRPQTAFGLWQCGCGSWQTDNSCCVECGADKDLFDSALNPQTISKNLSEYKEQQAKEKLRLEAERKVQEKAEEERKRIEAEKKAAQERIQKEQEEKKAIEKKQKKKKLTIIAAALAVATALLCGYFFYLVPQGHYDKGLKLTASQQWDEATEEFNLAGSFKDASTQILVTRYKEGEAKRSSKDWDGAIKAFGLAIGYSDSQTQIQKTYYEKGKNAFEQNDWDNAIVAFGAAGNYEDAAEQIKATNYSKGIAKRESKEWYDAEKAFENADDYLDSKGQLKETQYLEAIALRTAGDWDKAIKIFTSLSNYSDSATQISETYYQQADSLEKAGETTAAKEMFISLGNYRDAFERAYKPDYDLGIALRQAKKWDEAISAFERAGSYSDASTQISETLYQEAAYYSSLGKYEDAYLIYAKIKNYRDVSSLINQKDIYEAKRKLFTTPGNIVTFGHYEQDNNRNNGAEPIEWIVIGGQDNRCFLLSRYVLDKVQYEEYDRKNKANWKESNVRKWLNETFMENAFNSDEQSAILLSEVDNSSSQGAYYSKSCDNTQDKIYLLSYKELFAIDSEFRTGKATKYAESRSVRLSSWDEKSGGCEWWLRTLGEGASDRVCIAHGAGSVYTDGFSASNGVGARPVMWLDIDQI